MISRLHVGLCNVSYSFLLKREEPPIYIACDERLTVEHLLLFCFVFVCLFVLTLLR